MGKKISLERFSAAVAALHEAAASPEQWSESLAQVVGLLEASKGAIIEIDAAAGHLTGVTAIGHAPEAQRAYAEHYYAVDPTMHACLAMPANQPATVYEQFPAAVRSRGEYFAFARSFDIGDVVGVGTRSSDRRRTVLSLQRPVKSPPFDAEAKRILALLAPHLEIAKRIQRQLADATAAREALAAGLDRFAHPAFIVEAGGRIRHMNTAAEQFLRQDGRLRSAGGKLISGEPALGSALAGAVRDAAGIGARSSWLALPAEGGRGSAEIVVSALREHHPLAPEASRRLALVLVAHPQRDAAAIAARMRQLCGLTAAEGRIVAALALGRRVEEIALANQVSEATLRSQLRSIYAKTGVSRQADVVRLALAGLPVT